MANTSEVTLSLQLKDSDLDAEELESMTQTMQQQLRDIAEQVERVPLLQTTPSGELVEKGDKKEPGLLQMEVNLENIGKLAAWIYQRVAGRSTKAKIKFGEGAEAVEFEFEGNSQKDLAATLDDVADFMKKIQQSQS
ncbi:MAG: hypothetical protein AAFZ49_13965 [Cyanobacteria bacterium J06659_2]